MKKIIALVVALMMVLGMAVACQSAAPSDKPVDDTSAVTPTDTSTSTDVPAETYRTPVAKEDLKIGVVHINDASDQGYSYNHELGALGMIKSLGLEESQYIPKYNVAEDDSCATAINELIEEGCQIIFTTSFSYGSYTMEAAKAHPEIEFCHATGSDAVTNEIPNLHNYFAKIHEARYLAGIAAGLKTETNKLGYVGAFPFAEVISGFTAFYLGAKSVNPDVTMDVIYVNTWSDANKEGQAAQALIDRGCDVVSQHSDTTGPATTAEKNGKFHVGYNNDMIPAAPNASLISARIDWSKYMTYAVQCMIDGTAIDRDWGQGYKEAAVYLSPLNEKIAAEGTKEAIEAAEAKFMDGSLQVFQGPLLDAAGKPAEIKSWDGSAVLYTFTDEAFEEPMSAPSFNAIIAGINIVE
ncbi:MAG: BMP family ABC transporter substrate-binding protein [Clostridia bacterium]